MLTPVIAVARVAAFIRRLLTLGGLLTLGMGGALAQPAGDPPELLPPLADQPPPTLAPPPQDNQGPARAPSAPALPDAPPAPQPPPPRAPEPHRPNPHEGVTAPRVPLAPEPPRSPEPPAAPRPNPHKGIVATRAFGDDEGTPRGTLLAPTLAGPSGLFRTSVATPGPDGSWRLALRTEYASSNGFIVQGDSNQRLAGGLTGAFTIDEHWEVFGALLAATNRNRRCADNNLCVPETDRRDPVFIRSFGDAVVGGKSLFQVKPSLDLGLELGMRLHAASDELGFDWNATSFWVLALGSWDVGVGGPLPVIVHANAGYIADRSYRLASFELPNNPSVHSRAVAGYAYGIGRGRFRGGLALEAPITNLVSGSRFSPFFEYQIERVVGSGDPAFAAYLPPGCGNAPGQTRCAESRVQQRIVFGLRANWTNGLSLDVGVEIGAGSVGYPFGPPLAPWNLILGLGRSSTPAPTPRVMVVERVVEVPAPVKTGTVSGRVVDGQNQTPIAGAIVAPAGAARSRVATDPDGSFVSRELLPGQQDLEVSAPGFDSVVVRAVVTLGTATPIEVTLRRTQPPTPTPPTESPSPPPTSNAPAPPEGVANGAKGGVALNKGRVVLPRPIKFASDSGERAAELTDDSQVLLRQVAAVLKAQPEASRARIEAHWDSSLEREAARRLTQQQADTIARALTAAGIAPERIEAVGMGSSQPKGLNIGPLSRARNRRIEITVPAAAAR
jgi:outer membrane protein OmpA-like peptidoglycan-associated protein